MQKTYIEKFLNKYQMNNYNLLPKPMVEKLNLEPREPDFTLNTANITTYKKFSIFV